MRYDVIVRCWLASTHHMFRAVFPNAGHVLHGHLRCYVQFAALAASGLAHTHAGSEHVRAHTHTLTRTRSVRTNPNPRRTPTHSNGVSVPLPAGKSEHAERSPSIPAAFPLSRSLFLSLLSSLTAVAEIGKSVSVWVFVSV